MDGAWEFKSPCITISISWRWIGSPKMISCHKSLAKWHLVSHQGLLYEFYFGHRPIFMGMGHLPTGSRASSRVMLFAQLHKSWSRTMYWYVHGWDISGNKFSWRGLTIWRIFYELKSCHLGSSGMMYGATMRTEKVEKWRCSHSIGAEQLVPKYHQAKVPKSLDMHIINSFVVESISSQRHE